MGNAGLAGGNQAMTRLLDVNALFALVWRAHEHHRVARKWFRQNRDFATCPLTQLAFLRLSTNPAIGWELYLRSARAALADLVSLRGHHFWPDDVEVLESLPLARTPDDLTDGYLAALAKAHQGCLATFDAGISRLPAIDPSCVEVIG